MVRAGGVAERRPDAPELLRRELLARQALLRLVPGVAHDFVQVLGERLRKPVGEGLDHDRPVVVVLGLVTRGELVRAVDGDGERADVVAVRADVVGQAAVRTRVAVRRLLAQEAEAAAVCERDVVAVGPRRPPAVDAPRL